MKSLILHFLFFFFLVSSLQAQKANSVFAITADNTGNNPSLWANINEVNVKTGQVIRPLLDNTRTSFNLYDGVTKTKLTGLSETATKTATAQQNPVAKIIAAAAYDARHNRLFVAPLQSPELRWINLDDNTAQGLKIYTITLPFSQPDLSIDGNQLTRMVIAADGYGYALTNDANHLFRFSTGRKITVTDLGALTDASVNGTMSVHNKTTSFGGDMVSDEEGNLYLFSAYHNIFKIDLASKMASFIGAIKNLPANYTTNGAAVNDDGNLIVSSASSTEGYYSVNMITWEAVKVTGDNKTAAVSDLASSHFAFQKKQRIIPAVLADKITNNITVYPNPVTTPSFRISFNNINTGRYMVQMVDVSGRLALQQPTDLFYQTQVLEMKMPANFSKGVYTVKVVNAGGTSLYSGKILVN